MKFILILINLCLLIAAANAHGYVTDPAPRGNGERGQIEQFSGARYFQYYYRGGAMHVCGNDGWGIENTQKTGNVVKTYKSGERVLMNINFAAGHEGYFRMKLCKLNNPTDEATQACFDQELLKIQSLDYYSTLAPSVNVSFRIDDYTIRTPTVRANGKDDSAWEFKFYVQLPAGLTCENCVLQWDWHQSSAECLYADGRNVGSYIGNPVNRNSWLPGYGDVPCAHTQYRSCHDIKITAGTAAVYKANPVKPSPNLPPVFSCEVWNDEYYANINQNQGKPHFLHLDPNERSDPNKFVGAGVICFWSTKISGAYTDALQDSISKTCRENCMSPDKKCPSQCFCRWFPRQLPVYQNPIASGDWNK